MAEQLAKAKRDPGAAPPPPPPEVPAPAAGDAWWLTAFRRLSTCRPLCGDELGPIPWPAMRDYATDHQLPPVLRVLFLSIMEELDRRWLEHVAKLRPATPPPPAPGAGAPRKRSGSGARRLGR